MNVQLPSIGNYSIPAFNAGWGLFKNCLALCLLLLNLGFSNSLSAQERPVKRVLVLHGVWSHDTWESNFDIALSSFLQQSAEFNVEMSSRYLGLDTLLAPQSRINLENEIRTAITDQSIDLVIAVLPGATEFIADLEGIAGLPQIRVLPNPNAASSIPSVDNNIVIVESAGKEFIRNTLNQILQLRPQTSKIEIIGGVSETDTSYLNLAQEVLAESTIATDVEFLVGEQPNVLLEHLKSLTEKNAVLLLPFESYSDEALPVPLNNDVAIMKASAAPVFGIVETSMGIGMVGGQFSSIPAIADATAEFANHFLAGNTPEQGVTGSFGKTIYDARAVERWGLDLDLLTMPYELKFQSTSLWDERPILVLTVANLMGLLAILAALQANWLRKSKAVQAQLSSAHSVATDNEKKYRVLADNSLDVIWTWDEDAKKFIYCSPSILKLTNYSADEFTSLPITTLFPKKSLQLIKSSLDSNVRLSTNFEVELLTKQGDIAWCEIVAQYNQDKNPAFNGWIAVSRNITERRSMQKERAALENHVREAQKFDSLGTLAGGIAHDINNILSVIMGASDLLKSETTKSTQAQKLLTSITTASGNAKDLVNQILTFSRRHSTEKMPFNFSQNLREAFNLLESGIPDRLNLKLKIEESDFFVLGDETQSKQLILNLVTNASDSITSAGGNITISLHKENLESTKVCQHGTLQAGNYAVLTVKDDGIGISEEQMGKIFDPFYTNKDEGNGLGLAIVYGVTMDLKGAIGVQSSVGVGTQFSIYLPLTATKQSRQETKPEFDSGLQDLHIAIIDDKEDILDICSLMISHLGHRCTGYSESKFALQKFKEAESMPDLVITDYSMPGLSGMELISRLDEEFPSLPIIVSTGYGEDLSKFDLNDLSRVKATLPKPFTLDQLHQTIISVMSH